MFLPSLLLSSALDICFEMVLFYGAIIDPIDLAQPESLVLTSAFASSVLAASSVVIAFMYFSHVICL